MFVIKVIITATWHASLVSILHLRCLHGNGCRLLVDHLRTVVTVVQDIHIVPRDLGPPIRPHVVYCETATSRRRRRTRGNGYNIMDPRQHPLAEEHGYKESAHPCIRVGQQTRPSGGKERRLQMLASATHGFQSQQSPKAVSSWGDPFSLPTKAESWYVARKTAARMQCQ